MIEILTVNNKCTTVRHNEVEKWSIHSFLTTAHNKLMWLVIFYYFFTKRKEKKTKRNDPYTHFSKQPHNKLMWLVIFYYFFCFLLFSFCKKIIKYYQPHQLIVGLLWEMSVGIISLSPMKWGLHIGLHSIVSWCCALWVQESLFIYI
jgi:hypothetical protein